MPLHELGQRQTTGRAAGNSGHYIEQRSSATIDGYRRTLRDELSAARRRELIQWNPADRSKWSRRSWVIVQADRREPALAGVEIELKRNLVRPERVPVDPIRSRRLGQCLMIVRWQVLDSNQRRRCRQIYKPPEKRL